MAKVTDLSKGTSISEFARPVDPPLWSSYYEGITKFIEASGGIFSSTGTGRIQQQFQQQYIRAQRKLAQKCLEQIATQKIAVSGIVVGTATRVEIDADMLPTVTIWNFRENWVGVPHGVRFDHVRIHSSSQAGQARPKRRLRLDGSKGAAQAARNRTRSR